MKRVAMFWLFLLSLISPVACRAGNLSLGVGYPYVSTKYNFKTLAVEGKYINGSGVQAYMGRVYCNLYRSGNIRGFTGLEGGYVKFNTLNTKGTGNEAALFVGGEYFATKNLSLMMDFAPTLISLRSGHTNLSRVEYVINFGLYVHFGKTTS